MLATFRTGATLVLEKGYGYPYEIIKVISQHRVTGFAGSPTVWSLLLNLPTLAAVADAGAADPDSSPGVPGLASLRYITNAAAGLPAAFIPRLRAVIPKARIYLMHGQTECIRTTFLPPAEITRKPTSVGKGMRNVELWIEDDDGKRLGPGEIGEMVVRGSVLMAGYWNDPEGTSRVLFPGDYPWERVLHTNDLFRMDEEGYFHFVSRNDEIIKSRGEKVSPFEVEGVIYRMEEVAECRVVGVPDPILGHAIRAEIVLKPGKTCDDRALKSHCAKFLEPYKIPTQIVRVDQIPKTVGGKIRRVGTP
jgi:acyl-coenzyme A synthetase/AMP-(fatty) acid ligase